MMAPSNQNHSIALIGGAGLGDNLIQMIIANNAQLAGYKVIIFSNVMAHLKNWFPQFRIFPSLKTEQYTTHLDPYEHVFSAHKPVNAIDPKFFGKWVYFEKAFHPRKTRVENVALSCQNFLDIDKATTSNGITVLDSLQYRKNKTRVVLHPTSAR